MNTIADFQELLLQRSLRIGKQAREKKACRTYGTQDQMLLSQNDLGSLERDIDEPSLTSSETSFSSLDELWSTSFRGNDEHSMLKDPFAQKPPRRRVGFYSHVEVREYSLTLSEHPYCEDPYPISLDWAFAPPYIRHIETSKMRDNAYTPGRRLLVDEKRQRLSQVLGCSEDDVDELAQPSLISLGRSVITFVAKFIPVMLTSNVSIRNVLDEDDEEFLLMYAGTKEVRRGLRNLPGLATDFGI